ncbi:MAG TPA: hypothetical protein VEA40_00480 [Ramlibacter sp.]|nr:hypothetical protein [Ramlibacter sp.]
MHTTRGAAAYAAYSLAVGGRTFDGSRELPKFEELGQAQQNGWTAAADTGGFAVSIGDAITTRQGTNGEVTSLSIGRTSRGVWIEGKDSTGRPFEQYVLEADIASVGREALAA